MSISFTELNVYKLLYKACLKVHKEVLVNLPENEKYGLTDQISRACKAPLALIGEAYGRRSYQKEWVKYLSQAVGECNEMMVHLSLARDLYGSKIQENVCEELIEMYNISGKQLFMLGKSWKEK